jgi:16S rRNA (uracil1498-N3)-methyltransferase
MALPLFYTATYDPGSPELTLDEDNSRHIIQVLRMKPGEPLRLTDGKGHLLESEILDDHKKKCRVRIQRTVETSPPDKKITIAISPVKNATRFEWFLEKAAEIGVSAIIPLLCERTERASIRTDRLRNILVSAMLQSQQVWLPELSEPMSFSQVVRPGATAGGRYIAHLLEAPRATASLAALTASAATGHASSLILIGPEGDFSQMEVEEALAAGFIPVSLGHNRLRTETAGVVAATLLCVV